MRTNCNSDTGNDCDSGAEDDADLTSELDALKHPSTLSSLKSVDKNRNNQLHTAFSNYTFLQRPKFVGNVLAKECRSHRSSTHYPSSDHINLPPGTSGKSSPINSRIQSTCLEDASKQRKIWSLVDADNSDLTTNAQSARMNTANSFSKFLGTSPDQIRIEWMNNMMERLSHGAMSSKSGLPQVGSDAINQGHLSSATNNESLRNSNNERFPNPNTISSEFTGPMNTNPNLLFSPTTLATLYMYYQQQQQQVRQNNGSEPKPTQPPNDSPPIQAKHSPPMVDVHEPAQTKSAASGFVPHPSQMLSPPFNFALKWPTSTPTRPIDPICNSRQQS